MQVVKRDGKLVDFDQSKIRVAIEKAKLNIVGSQNTRMMATNDYSGNLWNGKRSTVTKIVFQDSINKIEGESESWDISSAKNKTVMARLVPNTDDTATNTLYIQGNGGVLANYNSSDLFCNFSEFNRDRKYKFT